MALLPKRAWASFYVSLPSISILSFHPSVSDARHSHGIIHKINQFHFRPSYSQFFLLVISLICNNSVTTQQCHNTTVSQHSSVTTQQCHNSVTTKNL